MIELQEFPWIPCRLVQRRLLGRAGLPHAPLFVDFRLRGLLASVLRTGHHELPAAPPRLRARHARLAVLQRPA